MSRVIKKHKPKELVTEIPLHEYNAIMAEVEAEHRRFPKHEHEPMEPMTEERKAKLDAMLERINKDIAPHSVTTSVKHDQNKPDLSMIPMSAKVGIAKAFMDGEKKYGRYNYLKGMEWTRLLAAADRHLSAFNDGEDNASDSGLNHLYHAGACISMLIEYYVKGLGEDNRWKQK